MVFSPGRFAIVNWCRVLSPAESSAAPSDPPSPPSRWQPWHPFSSNRRAPSARTGAPVFAIAFGSWQIPQDDSSNSRGSRGVSQ
ncbi:MAG: hypothetical protein HW377_1338 [Actinobacteria bacterium]|nr:hypothetical protein [Actinomycetota bacterium]